MGMLAENVFDFVHWSIHDITLYIFVCIINIYMFNIKGIKEDKLTSAASATFNSHKYAK